MAYTSSRTRERDFLAPCVDAIFDDCRIFCTDRTEQQQE